MTFMKFNPNDKYFTEDSEYDNEEMLNSYRLSAYNWKPGMKNKDGELMKLRMSKSSIMGFAWCPYQYYLEKVLGHRTTETAAMVKGTNIHNIVEYFWKAIPEHLEEIESLVEENKHNQAYEILRKVIPEPPEPYQNNETASIETWLNWQWDRYLVTKGQNWIPIANEEEVHAMFDVEINGTKIPVHMKGYIDTIFSDGEGGSILMELKTGKWNKYKAAHMRKEMQIYKMMLENSPEGVNFLPITSWAWEFPSGDVNGGEKKEWEIEYMGTNKTRYAPKTVQKLIEALVKAHLFDDFKPKHNSSCKSYCRHENICSWCDFMDICPGWNGGEENAE